MEKGRGKRRGVLFIALCCLLAMAIWGHALAGGAMTADSATDEINIGFRFSKSEYIIETFLENGQIVPNGAVKVKPAANQTFAFTPNTGYQLNKVLVDGQVAWDRATAQGQTPTGYVFRRVLQDHTLEIQFRAEPTTEPTTSRPTVPPTPTPTPTTAPTQGTNGGGPGGPGVTRPSPTPTRLYELPDDDIPQSGVGGNNMGDCID